VLLEITGLEEYWQLMAPPLYAEFEVKSLPEIAGSELE
jgi:hypothetical protein